MKKGIERRSAKSVVENYAQELLNRTTDPAIDSKLAVLEVIAMRMSWNDLYHKLRSRRSPKTPWWVEK